MQKGNGHCAQCDALALRLEELQSQLDAHRETNDARWRIVQADLRRVDAAAADAAEDLRATVERVARLNGLRFTNPNAHAQYLCDLLAERLQDDAKGGA